MKIINLTPHEIIIITKEGVEMHIPPSGIIARCTTTREVEEIINVDGVEIPINRTVFGTVENLPDPQPDTLYIVSTIVANAVKGKRNDIIIPDDTIRDEQGRIIGARAFARL